MQLVYRNILRHSISAKYNIKLLVYTWGTLHGRRLPNIFWG